MIAEATARAAPVLAVEALHVRYGAIHGLQGVSLEVLPGEVVALIGANGAGKTTTLRAVSGLVKPSSGRVRLLGEDVTGKPAERLVGRGLAHAPEGRGIFANLTVRENLDLGAYRRRDRDGIRADRERGLALFPILAERATQLAGTLLGGEQQMLAVARALMSRPKLLLLDEPSLGLAPQVAETIFRTLEEIHRSGVSILLVEQNAARALALADRAYVLETGQVAMQGSGADLLASAEVRRAYLGES